MENENLIDSAAEVQPLLQLHSDSVVLEKHQERRPLSWYWCVSLTPQHKETLSRLGLQPIRLIQHMMNGKAVVAGLFHKLEGGQSDIHSLSCTRQALREQVKTAGWKLRFLSNEWVREDVRLNLGYEFTETTSTRVHVDLSSLELHSLLAESISVVDIVTYEVNSVQRFALITDTHQPTTFVLSGASAHEINAWLQQTRLVLKRVRSYQERGETRIIAVACRSSVQRWSWVANVNSEVITNRLRSQEYYPVDLDVSVDAKGRSNFSAVFYRWKQ